MRQTSVSFTFPGNSAALLLYKTQHWIGSEQLPPAENSDVLFCLCPPSDTAGIIRLPQKKALFKEKVHNVRKW
jgi:hypothetical protein